MVSAMEFSYLNAGFSLNIDESVLSRAVRVKSIVKDKIKRIFDNNVETRTAQDVVSVTEKTSLLDLSEETLNNISGKLEKMQRQNNVPCVSNRAVLFTSGLVSKIRLVTDKWYPYKQNLQFGNVELNSINVTNNLGGEVVPGSWNAISETVEQVENEFVPTMEEEFVPDVKTNVSVEEQNESPNFEGETSVDIVSPVQVKEPPVVEYSLDNNDIYSFVPNMDDLIPTVMPNNFSENVEVTDNAEEIVPEPQNLSLVNENEFVPEPISIPAVESVSIAQENDSLVNEENKVVNEEKNVKPNVMSIEDKIAELLQRKNSGFSPKSVSIATQESNVDSENTFNKGEEKSELTQTHVLARLRRVLNETSEKDEVIKKLDSKNKGMIEEISQAKDKIRGYEAVVSDLTARNDSLLKENEKLSARIQEIQISSQSTISKLEAQVEDLNKARNEESESSKGVIAELKIRHAEELADLKEKHARELRSVNESKERQIQAIYATISDVLSDSSIDDNYGRSMAA